MLPAAGGLRQGARARRLAADRADERPGRRRSRTRAARRGPALEPRRRASARAPSAARRGGELELLYVSPERLATGGFLERARARASACSRSTRRTASSHWGHDFRPEYRQLAALCERRPARRVHGAHRDRHAAGAATTSCAQLGLRDPRGLVGHLRPAEPDLPVAAAGATARARCWRSCAATPARRGIVYCLSRKDVEELADALARPRGHAARLPRRASTPPTRVRVQDAFVDERLDVVVGDDRLRDGDRPHRTCASWCTRACPRRSSTTSRRPGAPVATACRPSACCSSAGELFRHWQHGAVRRAAGAGAARRAGPPARGHRPVRGGAGLPTPLPRRALRPAPVQDGPGGCGACDVCLGRPELPADEALVIAQNHQRRLRCGKRFGAAHVTEVLRGVGSDKVLRLGHEQLSVFGLLAQVPERAVRSWIDQLVVQGFLEIGDKEGLPLLAMTEAAGHSAAGGRGAPRSLRGSTGGGEGEGLGQDRACGARGELGAEGAELFERLRAPAPADRRAPARSALRRLLATRRCAKWRWCARATPRSCCGQGGRRAQGRSLRRAVSRAARGGGAGGGGAAARVAPGRLPLSRVCAPPGRGCRPGPPASVSRRGAVSACGRRGRRSPGCVSRCGRISSARPRPR